MSIVRTTLSYVLALGDPQDGFEGVDLGCLLSSQWNFWKAEFETTVLHVMVSFKILAIEPDICTQGPSESLLSFSDLRSEGSNRRK